MLFSLEPITPKFEVFKQLNNELLYFLEQALPVGTFTRNSLSAGAVGKACWDNVKGTKGKERLTKDKFQELHSELQKLTSAERKNLFETVRDNQNLQGLFAAPNHQLLTFLTPGCLIAFKELASHLYCSTKSLQPVIDACGGVAINTHFNNFKMVNGDVCRACGLERIAPFRANTPLEEQWRADYDHLLCKSKYPLYAVHPDNLFPICQICNQDAKKAEDLFFCRSTNRARTAFYPFTESAKDYVALALKNDRDPEVCIQLNWQTDDALILEKLNTWNDVFQIKNLVEGRLVSLANIIQDELNPTSLIDLQNILARRVAPPPNADTLKRKPEVFWLHKLYSYLASIDLALIWDQCHFIEEEHGQPGGEYILVG
ncbi:hypothetical protein [Shewanella baltica]|uniref:hypothetical protein n=1 Tax=Shewanella baltica TaxID=62322 RepID=UPI00325F5842